MERVRFGLQLGTEELQANAHVHGTRAHRPAKLEIKWMVSAGAGKQGWEWDGAEGVGVGGDADGGAGEGVHGLSRGLPPPPHDVIHDGRLEGVGGEGRAEAAQECPPDQHPTLHLGTSTDLWTDPTRGVRDLGESREGD